MEAMTAHMRLWEVGDEIAAIGEELMESGGELTPEMEARLDAMTGAWEEKVERIALYALERKATAAGAKLEAERLAAIQRSHERAHDGLKGYLHREMERIGRPKLETARVRIRTQRNGRPSITWPGDPAEAPEGFRRVTVTVDGAAAYDAWRAGDPLDGFVVVTGTHLRLS